MLINMIYNGELTLPKSAEKTGDGYYLINHGGRAWLVKFRHANTWIDDVHIEELDHNFGRYKISMVGHPGGTQYAIEGELHPHVLADHACWGDLHYIAHQFLGENDPENFVGIVEQLLRSYNEANAYTGWWGDYVCCADCEGRVDGRDNAHQCTVCGELFCSECVVRCDRGLFWHLGCAECRSVDCVYRRECSVHVYRYRQHNRVGPIDLDGGNPVQDALPF